MDLHGWDTLCAIPVAVINAQLAAALPSLDPHVTSATSDLTVDLEMGPWVIVGSDTPALIDVAIPIATGSALAGVSTTDIEGVVVTVEMLLELRADTPDGPLLLRLRTSSDPGSNAPVIVRSVVPPAAQSGRPARTFDPDVLSAVGDVLASAVVQRAGVASPVLATLGGASVFNALVARGSSDVLYAAAAGNGPMIIALSSARKAAPGGAIDPGIIPAGCQGLFVASNALLLSAVIAPVIEQIYRVETSVVDGVITTIRPFPIEPVQYEGMEYDPVITTLGISVDDHVRATVRGTCYMGIGFTMSFQIGDVMPVTWDADGKSLLVDADPAPTNSYELDASFPGADLVSFLIGWIVDAFARSILAMLRQALSAIIPYGNALPLMVGPSTPFTPTDGRLDDAFILSGAFG